MDHRELYKYILDNLYEGVYFVDLQREIIFWNEAAEKITGYKAEEVVGSHCYDNILVHVDEHGNSLCKGTCPLMKTMKSGESIDAKVYLHHRDGHRVPVYIKTIPVKNEETGEIDGGIEIFKTSDGLSENEKKIEELEKLALRDELCQIPNRRFLNERLEMLLEMFKRFDMPFAILFLDIDHFKRVNDNYSHDVGDQILKMVSKTVSGNLRENDIVARWGGEEFVVCLNGVERSALSSSAERIRMLIENSFINLEGERLGVTISIGATMAKKEDTIETLLNRADKLLYTSKKTGRNKCTLD